MRIYLDSCCLQRPLDNQTHSRIRVETEAVFSVLAAVQAKELALLDSDALRYEVSQIPDDTRRTEVFSLLSLACEHLPITDAVEALALTFEQHGLRAIDAIHLAIASMAQADYFCTCDDKLFRRASVIPGLACRVITLLNLAKLRLEPTKHD
uniref:PIN domain-containing protein n=2 Tax=Candidatus Kentrum sp. LPFa TaxID=2126335 RepID=A0A450WEM2_9GAMM|nr:MAG: PIN domain-containing protein [Candidatus Kentron sp. LPFa]VFK31217.1 MAG: PIN domain-containing protein [Candidatus Kentron sp. LPFa]